MDERQDDENLVEYILFQQVDLRRRPNSQVAGINVDVVFAATNCGTLANTLPCGLPLPSGQRDQAVTLLNGLQTIADVLDRRGRLRQLTHLGARHCHQTGATADSFLTPHSMK